MSIQAAMSRTSVWSTTKAITWAGEAIFGPAAARRVLAQLMAPQLADPFPQLAPREHEVLGRLADGLPNSAIAIGLGLSPTTVNNLTSSSSASCRSRGAPKRLSGPETPGYAGAENAGEARGHPDPVHQVLGIPVVPGWIEFEEMRPGLAQATRATQSRGWGPHLVSGDDGPLVGFGGSKGPPVAGAAELGCAGAPARRGRGIGTAVVRQLVATAGSELARVVAHALAGSSASTAVLRRCGFMRVAELVDPDHAHSGVGNSSSRRSKGRSATICSDHRDRHCGGGRADPRSTCGDSSGVLGPRARGGCGA
jgi:RimJ/RimL family protein N-acetyltransferase